MKALKNITNTIENILINILTIMCLFRFHTVSGSWLFAIFVVVLALAYNSYLSLKYNGISLKDLVGLDKEEYEKRIGEICEGSRDVSLFYWFAIFSISYVF